MALETGALISSLDVANPIATDAKSQGDDHFRLIKTVLKTLLPSIATSSGADTIVLTQSPALPSYEIGYPIYFHAGATNTGAATININGLGAIAVEQGGNALAAGAITVDHITFGVLRLKSGTTTLQLLSSYSPKFGSVNIDGGTIDGVTITAPTMAGAAAFTGTPTFANAIALPVATTYNSKRIAHVNAGSANGTGLISWGTAAPGTLAEGEIYLQHDA